jgi:GDP-4-dehydro-6-deoxy-D-mannose reductase
VGLGRRPAPTQLGERYFAIDVGDVDALTEIIDATRPDVVFHLASAVAQTVRSADELVRQVVGGTQSVTTAIRRVGRTTRLVLAGSSAQYGAASGAHARITETDACLPVNAYGHAKVAAEAIALAMAHDGGFDVVAARPFNHVGPGESTATVSGALAARIADVAAGRADRVGASDLDVIRDFTDIRDIVRGYVALAEHGGSGRVYNLCSGRGTTIEAILETLLDAAGLERSVVEVVAGNQTAIPYQVGSPVRTESETAWVARIEVAESLVDLLRSAHGATGQAVSTTSHGEPARGG